MKYATAFGAALIAVLVYGFVFLGTGEMRVDTATLRSSGMAGAAYFEIRNATNRPDRLLRVETPIAQRAELHENLETSDGIMQMRPLEDTVIPARSTIRFEQGGKHVMLMDLSDALVAGEIYPLTLHFETAGSIKVNAVVVTAP